MQIFLNRLNPNAVRWFVDVSALINGIIASGYWGQNIDFQLVTSSSLFWSSVDQLRSPAGRNRTSTAPINWPYLFNFTRSSIAGTDEYVLKQLKSTRISSSSILLELNMNFQASDNLTTTRSERTPPFMLRSFNTSDPIYWQERWVIYKVSYAIGVWARYMNVSMVEYDNEPDLIATPPSSAEYQDYYQLRTLSLQHAYADVNADLGSTINVNVIGPTGASYNADPYGAMCLQNNNIAWGTSTSNSKWTNIDTYAYHTYSASGSSMANKVVNVQNFITNSTVNGVSLPVMITEYNSHFGSQWSTILSTPDDNYEASRVASQTANVVLSQINGLFLFKMRLSVITNKNALVWEEANVAPYDFSDTTLSAESYRLLAKVQGAQIYTVTSNDTGLYGTYLSKSEHRTVLLPVRRQRSRE